MIHRVRPWVISKWKNNLTWDWGWAFAIEGMNCTSQVPRELREMGLCTLGLKQKRNRRFWASVQGRCRRTTMSNAWKYMKLRHCDSTPRFVYNSTPRFSSRLLQPLMCLYLLTLLCQKKHSGESQPRSSRRKPCPQCEKWVWISRNARRVRWGNI